MSSWNRPAGCSRVSERTSSSQPRNTGRSSAMACAARTMPGRWWGPGAKALGFEQGQVVEREPYDLLFGQRKAPDGTRLGKPPGNGRKAADLYAQLLFSDPHATAE